MRSLLIATAMCVAALTFTGCSLTVGSPCHSLCQPNCPTSCCGTSDCEDSNCGSESECPDQGCQDSGCDGCSTCGPKRNLRNWKLQPECSGVDFGEGAPCGMETMTARRPARGLLARIGAGGSRSACGCEAGDCSCESAPMVAAPVEVAPSMTDCGCDSGSCDSGCGEARSGLGLFGRSAGCGDDCDGSACGGACGGTRARTGLFSRGTACATNCDGNACGGACGAPQTRAGLFSRGQGCGSDCDGSACGGACGGTAGQAGLFGRGGMGAQGPMGGRMAGHHGQMRGAMYGGAAPAANGCGRFGCGRSGKLCLTCKARHGLGLGHHGTCGNGTCGRCKLCKNGMPYAGQVPHTVPTQGMTGQAPQYMYPYYTTRGPRDFLQDACAPGPILPYAPKKSCLPSIGF